MRDALTPQQGHARDAGGRFQPGNRIGRLGGNPYAKRIHAFRKALHEAVEPEDITAVARMLLGLALGGDVMAIRELLNRTVGKAPERVEFEAGTSAVEIRTAILRLIQDPDVADVIERKQIDSGSLLPDVASDTRNDG